MVELGKQPVETWFIVTSTDLSIIAFCHVDEYTEMISGLDILETFLVRQNCVDRLLELGVPLEEIEDCL